MKAKKIFLAIMVLSIALVLTSCGDFSPMDLFHTHTFASEWTSDNDYHWHAATCEHDTEVNDKAEHSWDLGVVTTEPTEEAAGEKTFTCSGEPVFLPPAA